MKVTGRSVCLVTLIELAGLGPTVRKTIRDPWSENLTYFLLCVLKYGLAVFALNTWSVAVAFYPTVNIVAVRGAMFVAAERIQDWQHNQRKQKAGYETADNGDGKRFLALRADAGGNCRWYQTDHGDCGGNQCGAHSHK